MFEATADENRQRSSSASPLACDIALLLAEHLVTKQRKMPSVKRESEVPGTS